MPPTYNLFRSVNPYFCRMFPQAPLLTLRGHQGAVYDLAWDASDRSWVSAGGDGVVARWSFGNTDGTALFQHASPFFAVTVWDDLVLGGNHTGELFVKTPAKHTVYTPTRRPFSPCLWMTKTACGAAMAQGWLACGHAMATTFGSNNSGTPASAKSGASPLTLEAS